MVMRKRHGKPRNPRPKIEYPPVETRRWIPPDQRPKKKRKPAYKKPSKLTMKLAVSSLKRVWHNFQIVDDDRMLLVGHYSQFYKKYGFRSNGFQAPCNCVVACTFAQLFDMAKWTPFTLDKILDVGDKLYHDSEIMQPAKNKKKLKLSDVYHTYYIGNFRVTMDTKGKQISCKMLPDPNGGDHFVKVAGPFFRDNGFAVIVVQGSRFFALWMIGNGYFFFDPCEHDLSGKNWTEPVGRGYCVLIRAKTLEVLRQVILDTFQSTTAPRPQAENPSFVLTACNIARKFEINKEFPQCLDDAQLEHMALSDADKKKIEEKQIAKLKAKGALPIPKPVDPNLIMIEDDDDDESGEEEEEYEEDEGLGLKAQLTPKPKDAFPKAVPGAAPKAVPGAAPKAVPGAAPKAVPGAVPKALPGALPKAIPGAVPGAPGETDEEEVEGEEEKAPKYVLKKVKPPIARVKPTSMTYFLDLVKDEVGILRASLHMGDKRFKRWAGKQSISMAVSALTMLRLYKSKYWTSSILDEILRNGNQYHRCTMKAYPGETVLKITSMCKAFKLNDKEYMPKIEEYGAVGKLCSDNEEVVDLLPGLKQLLSENDMCIILGPLTVAVWYEWGTLYMFDPHERDEKGLKLPPPPPPPPPPPKKTKSAKKLDTKKTASTKSLKSAKKLDTKQTASTKSLKPAKKLDTKQTASTKSLKPTKPSDAKDAAPPKTSDEKDAKTLKTLKPPKPSDAKDAEDAAKSKTAKPSDAKDAKDAKDAEDAAVPKIPKPPPLPPPTGFACLTRFTSLKQLVEMYLKNLEREQRREQFFLCTVQIEDVVKLPPNYQEYKALSSCRWLLLGTFSQNNKKFDDDIRNTQCTAIAAFAVAMNKMKNVKLWNTALLDKIVEQGSKYYKECITSLQAKNKFVSRLLMVDELNPTFKYEKKEIVFEFQSCLVNGNINNKDSDEVPNLKVGLNQFFVDSCCGILTCRGISVAVFCLEKVYYYFDSHTRNDQGLPSFYGTSIAIKSDTVEDLANAILANLSADTNNLYNLSRVAVEIYEGDGVPKPPLNHFIGLDRNRAILRSKYNEKDERFGLHAGKQTICMNLTALAMSRIVPTLTWSVDVINEVMELGNQMYARCMEKNIEDEDKGRSVDVPPPAPPPEVKIEEPKAEEKEEEDKKGKRGARKGKKGGRGKKKKEEEEAPPPPPTPPPPPEPEKPAASAAPEDPNAITSANVGKTFNIGINKFDVDFTEVQEGTYATLEETLKKVYVSEKDVAVTDKPTESSILRSPSPAPTEPAGGETAKPEADAGDDQDDRKLHLIESKHMTCVMWKEGQVYYVFDPKQRDESGQIYGKNEWPQKKPPKRARSKCRPPETDTGGGGDMTSDTAGTQSDKKSDKSDLENLIGGHEYKGDVDCPEDMYAEEEEEYIPPMKVHSAHYWLEKAKNGKAYVLRFIYPEDLVKHIVGNTPPLQTELPFKLTTIRMKNVVLQKDIFDDDTGRKSDVKNVGDWNNFKEIDRGRWILRGTITAASEMFPETNRDRQSATVAFVALTFQHLYSLPVFKVQTVNDIIMYGDRLYTFSFNECRKTRKAGVGGGTMKDDELDKAARKDMEDIDKVVREFCIACDMIKMTLDKGAVVGEINAEGQEKELDVKRGLKQFFGTTKTGMITAKDLLVAVWRKGSVYYMFDPNSRGPSGAKCVNGVACITRYLDVEALVDVFLGNLSTDGDNRFSIHAVGLESLKCPRQEVRKTKPKLKPTAPMTGYTTVSPGKTIIHGSISQRSRAFARQPDAQFAPMALVALSMTLVHNPLFWTRPIIDEIILIGDALYGTALDTMEFEYNPWEKPLTLDLTPKDFSIGELKANCEVRLNEQTGVVDVKHKKTLNLREGLEKFFTENTHGVIVTEPLSLAVWEEDDPKKILYMFDPGERGLSGMPTDREEGAGAAGAPQKGAACLLTFDSYKAASDHFIALLAPKTGVEFRIRPVEICVGTMKTKGKDKDKKKKKEETPLVVFGRAFGKKLSKPKEKRRLQEIMKEMRKEQEEQRVARLGRKTFYAVPGDEMSLIRGSRHQGSKFYSALSRDNQDIPNCLASYVMERLLPFSRWTGDVIDMVLDIGDQLYKDSCVAYRPRRRKLGLDSVIRDIVIRNIRVSMAIGKPVLINQFSATCIEHALEMFFRQKMYCMLQMNCDYIALFSKDDVFYMFDPHELNLQGQRCEGDGEAVLIKFVHLSKVAEAIVANYSRENRDDMIFSMILVAIKGMEKLPRKKLEPLESALPRQSTAPDPDRKLDSNFTECGL